jgi:hypothetical protein
MLDAPPFSIDLSPEQAMMGLRLAPATGKLVVELVGKKTPSVSLEQFGIR